MPRPVPHDPSAASPVARRVLAARVSRGRLQGPGYERLARGVHRAAGGPPLDHGDRIDVVRAAVVAPVVLAELSAAWTYGVREAAAGDDVVVIAAGRPPRGRDGLVVRRCRLEHHEVRRSARGWVTTPVRTACDVLRRLPRRRAVRTTDALLHTTGVTAEQVGEALAALPAGSRGAMTARTLLPLVDARSESPRESDLRLLLHDAGLPAATPQHEVRDAQGRFVARLDLAWPAARVAVEYDGAHHRVAGRHSADLARHNRLRALGWTVLQVDGRALGAPDELLHLLRVLLCT